MSVFNFVDRLLPERDEMVALLQDLVVRESPSLEKTSLDALSRFLAGRFEALGLVVERLAGTTGGDHLRVRFGDAVNGALPTLVLCHFDTVWPGGTVSRMPFRVEEGRAYGPGVYDMKASLVLVEYALRLLIALGLKPARPAVFLFTSDEEIGSPTSRFLIEAEALRSAHVLVMEPTLSGDRLKTARKGVGRFTLEVRGQAAHAGVEPEKGVSAVVELAHQVLALVGLADAKEGTTINVGVVQGGTTSNVVAANAIAQIDVRVSALAEARRVEDALALLRPVLPGASLTLRGEFNRPPMERTPQVAALFERVRGIGRTIGMELGEGSSGRGSDGNFTAALGVPTIDGLGVPGAGAHAENEHILIDAFPTRAALLASLLLEL
ncbi:MAG: M20 family metallopeptidase [Isosphaeraceae bacterium]